MTKHVDVEPSGHTVSNMFDQTAIEPKKQAVSMDTRTDRSERASLECSDKMIAHAPCIWRGSGDSSVEDNHPFPLRAKLIQAF